MTYLSIIEKFRILLELLFDYKYILVFMIILILLTFLFGIGKISSKRYTLFMIISFVIVFSISIISNYKILSNTFDNFTTIFFENIYFPSIYVYIGILVISFITFITSLLNKMIYKIYKIINTSMFILNNFLFVIILNIIAKNKIDIFSVNSLYANTTLVAILELSMGLSVLWILSLIVAYTTNVISERLAYKKTKNSNVLQALDKKIFNPLLEVDINLDKSSKDVVVERKNPALVEQISNTEEFIDTKVITKEKEIYFLDNSISEEKVTIETIEDIVEDINVGSNTEEDNHQVEDIIIDKNNTIEEVFIKNNVDTFNMLHDNVVVEKIDTQEENITTESSNLTFNDILNGCVPVNYYENNIVTDEYILYDPQKMYEDNYNKVKAENVQEDDISINDLIEKSLVDNLDNDTLILEDIKENDVLGDNLINKEMLIEERMHTNTVSLNDLIDEEEINNNEISTIDDYTVEDYKIMAKMLNDVKAYTNSSNINIDDAVAISLIRNYSIDECLKFKSILENNLN